MSWFEKLLPSKIRTEVRTKKSIPEGLWTKCEVCTAVLYRAEMERSLDVCPKCGYHMRINARRRLDTFLDPEPRVEIGVEIEPQDALRFRDVKRYKDRLVQAQKNTGERDARYAMIDRIAAQTRSDLVQRIGHVAVFFRRTEKPRIELN